MRSVLLAAAAVLVCVPAALAAVDGLDRHAAVGRFSGVIALSEGGRQTVQAFGQADTAKRVRNGAAVAYPLGSVTKVFTATAVMKLVEEGRLSLDDTVAVRLPEHADKPFAAVTVAQLLSHSGGVPSLMQSGQGLDDTMDFAVLAQPAALDASIAEFSAAPLLFKPGARYGYSNSGYLLLAKIVERTTGEPFERALRRLVLEPAGVSEEICLCADLPSRLDAVAYEVKDGASAPAPVIHHTRSSAAGGLRGTPEAMLAWAQALASGRILRPETLERMWTPVVRTRESGVSMALGWRVRETDGVKRVSHDGTVPGATGYLVVEPSRGRAAFGVMNRTLPLASLGASENYVRQVTTAAFEGRPLSGVPPLAKRADAALRGVYGLPDGRGFRVERDAAGALWLATDGDWSVFQLPKTIDAEGERAEDARTAIADWASGGQSALAKRFSDTMLKNVPAGALDGMWAQLQSRLGPYRSHRTYAVRPSGLAEVRIQFEKAALDVGVVYDAAGKIDGLQLIGEESATPPSRVRIWPTADGGLWIDGYPHGQPDLSVKVEQNGRKPVSLSFGSEAGLKALRR